jgi:hypothetical protein
MLAYLTSEVTYPAKVRWRHHNYARKLSKREGILAKESLNEH